MKTQVIVIEDDTDILDLIRYILVDEGFEVIGFNHLVSVAQIVAQYPLIVLLDILLQDGNGSALCKNIKSNHESLHIPVILVSALQNLEEIALQCQADGFLEKPFDLADLVNLVKKYNKDVV